MPHLQARKLRMAIAGFACLAALASAPLAVNHLQQGSTGLSLGGLSLGGLTASGLASGQRLMAMFDARSPGEREKGELSQTKIKHRLAAAPRQRALGKVFPPKPSPMEQLAKVVVPAPPIASVEAVPPVPPVAALTPLTPQAIGGIINPATLIASAPIAFGSALIGGSVLPPPTSVVTPPITVVPPPETVTSAVPEPGTWLMMLMGFGAVGAAMRRRRPTRALAG